VHGPYLSDGLVGSLPQIAGHSPQMQFVLDRSRWLPLLAKAVTSWTERCRGLVRLGQYRTGVVGNRASRSSSVA